MATRSSYMPKTITAKPYEARSKGEVKRLRSSGWVPATIQHRGDETAHVTVERRLVNEFIRRHGVSAIMEPTIEATGKRQTVQIHDIQRDPVSGQILHVTFQRIMRGDKVKAHVAIRLHGTPVPVRDKTAIVQQPLDHVDVECEPKEQPEHIDIDISDMDFHSVVRVSDLPHSDRYRILTPEDTVVASLMTLASRDVEAEEEAAGEAEQAAEAAAIPEAAE
jgi:large subunit ribosomal protein L25